MSEAEQPLLERVMAERWAFAKPLLERALEHNNGTHRIEDVAATILEGRSELWVGARCAAVTEILTYPRKRVWSVWLAGGDIREMQQMRSGMEARARALGCEAMQFCGRMTARAKRLNGWAKASGYDPRWVLVSKDI